MVHSWKQGESEIGVKVEDTGVGLEPENTEKIFDPFFTTKPHGIGMGLSISRYDHRIARRQAVGNASPRRWYYFPIHDSSARAKLG